MREPKKFVFNTNDFEPEKGSHDAFSPHDFELEGANQAPAMGQDKPAMPFALDSAKGGQSLMDVMPGAHDPQEWLKGGLQAAGALGMMAQPEVAAGRGILPYVANALGRTVTGSAASTALQAPEIKNRQDLQDAVRRNVSLNALLEGATTPFRLAGGMAEMFNPLKLAGEKANQIRNEATASKATMNEMYRPVNDAYNDFSVTVTPKNYMQGAGIKRSQLYPDAKIIYDDFLKDPTFNNLHRLQSKLGQDWARISQHPATAEKAQLFNQMRDSLQNKVQSFLSRDKNALSQYNLASQYAKDNYFPYLATPTLRNISKVKDINQLEITPASLAKSLKMGIKKTVGKEEKSLIPEGHPLRNHLNDIDKAMSFGKAAQFAVPALVGGVGGHLMHPGLGGIAGGTLGALGSSQIAKMASKFGAPSFNEFVQNPLIENVFKKLAPSYYGAGREAIGLSNKNS